MSIGHLTRPSRVQRSGYVSFFRREFFSAGGVLGGAWSVGVGDRGDGSRPEAPAHHRRGRRPPRAHRRAGWPGRARRLLRGDRGSVSAELAIATPLLLLMLLTIVQFALWSHATHIAQAAASQGLAAARAQGGTAAAGSTSAQQMLDQLARGPLTGTSVSSQRTATSASVRITGTASSVIPFLSLPVHAEAAGPVERFVPLAGGG